MSNFKSLTVANGELDFDLLNRACTLLVTLQGDDPEYEKINNTLIKFSERPDNFQFCFPIINGEYHTSTKFIAFRIVRNTILNKWNIFPDDEKSDIRTSILIAIVQMVKEGQKPYTISMADQALLEILKSDWPQEWPSFIEELTMTCQTETIEFMKNALDILKMLADEIAPSNPTSGVSITAYHLTRDRQRSMQAGFVKEFSSIYSLVETAFNLNQQADQFNSRDINDVNIKSLAALSSFIPIVGSERLLDTTLVSNIAPLITDDKFTFKVFSLFSKFCENVAQSDNDNSSAQQLEGDLLSVFQTSIEKIYSIYSEEINFNCVKKEDILLLISSVYEFLNLFIPIMDPSKYQDEISIAVSWIVQASTNYIDNTDELLFPEVIRFWHFFSVMLYRSASKEESQFQELYSSSLVQVIPFLISNIVCPYSFVEMSSEYGNHIQKSLSLNSYESSLYDTIKEILVVLCSLDKDSLSGAVSELITQLQNDEFDQDTINSISWTVGSISKALSDSENSELMNDIIPAFMDLIEKDNPTDDPTIEEIRLTTSKALLFLCSQEAKYFKNNPEFLNNLTQIIFRFLVSEESDLNIIAIHTFNLLSKSCKSAFITPLPPNDQMILDDILNSFPETVAHLRQEHRSVFVSAIADIIRVYESKNEEHQSALDILLDHISNIFNESVEPIEDILAQFSIMEQTIDGSIQQYPNLDNLTISFEYELQPPNLVEIEGLKIIINSIIMINALPAPLHSMFLPLLESILPKLVSLYELVTNNAAMIDTTDLSAEKDQDFVYLANASLSYYLEIANLITDLFKNTLKIIQENNPQFLQIVISSFVLGLNLKSLSPNCYPPNLLSMYGSIFQYTFSYDIENPQVTDLMKKIFFDVYQYIFFLSSEATKDEYDTLYELRVEMLRLIRGIIRGRPDLILDLEDEQQDFFIQVIMWLSKHPYEQISLSAVETCFILINSFKTSKFITYKEMVNVFWSKYYITFVSEMFSLLSDSTLKFGFDNQTLVLANLLQFNLASEQFDDIVASANEAFEKDDCEDLIKELISQSTSLLEFRSTLKDFLVNVKEYSPSDPELCGYEIFQKKRMESLAQRDIPALNNDNKIRPENVEEEMSIIDDIFSRL